MAIQMTRQQYEQQYGVKPVVSSSSLDTTPAPIRMTKAEYEATYRPQEMKEPGLGSQLKDRGSDILDAFKVQTSDDLLPGRSMLRVGGAVTGAVGDVIGAAISPILEKTTETLGGMSSVQKLAWTNIVGKGLDVANSAIEGTQNTWNSFEKAHPVIAQDLRDITNILSFIPVGKGSAVAADAVAPKLKPLIQVADDRAVNKVATEIGKVEEKYSPIRKANEFSKDVEGSRLRIAQSNVLENAVDENGLLRTKDAINAYRSMTVDGVEDVVRRNLVNEGKTINLNDLKEAFTVRLFSSGLEGGDLITAMKGIEKELKGLAIRADESGNVLLSKLQDAKISTTKNIDFNTPPETKTYRKAIARAYKEVIESTSEMNVKEVNARLSKYYSDIERLERLDGRRVEGGRLGKYTASIAGTAIGMGAGSVGGGLGAAVGGILGGEAAQLIKGKLMSGTFRKGVKGSVPDDAVLKNAKATADAGDALRKPSQPVVIPDSIKKTPQIKKLETQINRNIEAQKTAIKAGDFTLVATLKKIYDVLVKQLGKLVDEMVESVRNPTIGLSTKDVTKNIHPEDKAVMRAFINSTRLQRDLPIKTEQLIYKLFERFGINPDSNATLIANKFEKILENNTTKAVEGKFNRRASASEKSRTKR